MGPLTNQLSKPESLMSRLTFLLPLSATTLQFLLMLDSLSIFMCQNSCFFSTLIGQAAVTSPAVHYNLDVFPVLSLAIFFHVE